MSPSSSTGRSPPAPSASSPSASEASHIPLGCERGAPYDCPTPTVGGSALSASVELLWSPAPPSPGPAADVADLCARLRRSWLLAAHAATGSPEVGNRLAVALDDLARADRLDRQSLLDAVDEVAARLRRGADAAVEPGLTRRLKRSALEFLLAVDARVETSRSRPPLPEPVSSGAPAASLGSEPAANGRRRLAAALVDGDDLTTEVAAHVEVLLRRRRWRESADVLQRHAEERSVSGLAAIAVLAGDRCGDAGEARAAADCYLAALAADRLDEQALWRLAENAAEAHDTELAVSYLGRLADVLEWRGETRATTRVYRKLRVLAPERADVRVRLARLGQPATSR